jgi:hypothetical protein
VHRIVDRPAGVARRRRALLIAAAALLCACNKSEAPPAPAAPPGPPAPEQVAEHEPNDYLHAQQLPDRAVVSGSFAPPRPRTADDDWYRVAPGPGRTLAMRVELMPAHGAELEVLDRDRNRMLKLRTDGEPLLVPAIACVEACFVRVSSTEAGPYKLTVSGAPPVEGRELEPNDRAVDATALPVGKAIEGTYGWAEDEDWYRVEVNDAKPGQFLRVELTGVAGVRPEMEVRDLRDGAVLASVKAIAEGEGIFLRDLGLALGATPTATGTATATASPTATGTATASPTATATGTATATPTATASPTATGTATATPTASPDGTLAADAGNAPSTESQPIVPAPLPAGYYLVVRSAVGGTPKKPVRTANPRVP